MASQRPRRTRPAPRSVDEYLARLGDDQHAALERLRRIVRSAAPGAEECISYGLPAFRFEGRLLVFLGASARHCSFYPGGVIGDLGADLRGYDTSRGTIRFQPDAPIPAALVRRIVRTRIARNRAAAPAATGRRAAAGPRRVVRRRGAPS
jgi:uncharacterized protein YdhG (YjbR/CyaY superfamily)